MYIERSQHAPLFKKKTHKLHVETYTGHYYIHVHVY